MHARETERIIAFHGARRGAARIVTNAGGTRVALTLRPAAKGAPAPTAICIAGADGAVVRIPLSDGAGQTPLPIDPAVVLLVADSAGGEVFCAEGARGALDRCTVEMLKRPLRALREVKQERPAAPEQSAPEAPPQAAPSAIAHEQEPLRAEPPAQAYKQAAQPPAQPQSEALMHILSKANELFPPGGAEGGAAAHFASDEPLRGAFVPRPLAAQAERMQKNKGSTIRAGAVGAAGQSPPKQQAHDPNWNDAVRELSQPEAAPKPSGVGKAEAEGSLFPDAFPGVRWRRVRYPGTRRYYLEGTGMVDGARCTIYALPGENYPAQPYRSRGFTRFVRDVNGNGYWVKLKK